MGWFAMRRGVGGLGGRSALAENRLFPNGL